MKWPPVQRIVKKSIFVGCLSYPVDVVLGILSVNIFLGVRRGGVLIWITKMVTIVVEIIFDWFEIISVDLYQSHLI